MSRLKQIRLITDKLQLVLQKYSSEKTNTVKLDFVGQVSQFIDTLTDYNKRFKQLDRDKFSIQAIEARQKLLQERSKIKKQFDDIGKELNLLLKNKNSSEQLKSNARAIFQQAQKIVLQFESKEKIKGKMIRAQLKTLNSLQQSKQEQFFDQESEETVQLVRRLQERDIKIDSGLEEVIQGIDMIKLNAMKMKQFIRVAQAKQNQAGALMSKNKAMLDRSNSGMQQFHKQKGTKICLYCCVLLWLILTILLGALCIIKKVQNTNNI